MRKLPLRRRCSLPFRCLSCFLTFASGVGSCARRLIFSSTWWVSFGGNASNALKKSGFWVIRHSVVMYSLLLVVDEKSHALSYRPSLAYMALAHPYWVSFAALAKYSDQEAFQPMDYATILAFYGQQTMASNPLQEVMHLLVDCALFFEHARSHSLQMDDLVVEENVSEKSLPIAYRKVSLPYRRVFLQYQFQKNLLPGHRQQSQMEAQNSHTSLPSFQVHHVKSSLPQPFLLLKVDRQPFY